MKMNETYLPCFALALHPQVRRMMMRKGREHGRGQNNNVSMCMDHRRQTFEGEWCSKETVPVKPKLGWKDDIVAMVKAACVAAVEVDGVDSLEEDLSDENCNKDNANSSNGSDMERD
jgi:hypothetical protein